MYLALYGVSTCGFVLVLFSGRRQRRTSVGFSNRKRRRERQREADTRTNSDKKRASATTRQSERGEHVGMSQLPAGGLLKLWECLSLRPLKNYEHSPREPTMDMMLLKTFSFWYSDPALFTPLYRFVLGFVPLCSRLCSALFSAPSRTRASSLIPLCSQSLVACQQTYYLQYFKHLEAFCFVLCLCFVLGCPWTWFRILYRKFTQQLFSPKYVITWFWLCVMLCSTGEFSRKQLKTLCTEF